MINWLKKAYETVYGNEGVRGVAVISLLLIFAAVVAVSLILWADVDVNGLLGL